MNENHKPAAMMRAQAQKVRAAAAAYAQDIEELEARVRELRELVEGHEKLAVLYDEAAAKLDG